MPNAEFADALTAFPNATFPNAADAAAATAAAMQGPKIKLMLTNLRAIRTPPAEIKALMETVLIAFGHPQPQWSDVQSFLHITGNALAKKLLLFDLASMRPPQMQAIVAHTAQWSLEKVARCCKPALPLAMWAVAVSTYAAEQLAAFTNFVTLAPFLAHLPVGKLRKRFTRPPGIAPMDFCWRPGCE